MAHSSSIGESPSHVILKRKRTKRSRTIPPPPSTAAIATATAVSSASCNTTEEDHDMANCLILLSQGSSVPFNEAATPLSRPTGPASLTHLLLYECKTCSKRFPSFHALCGHRASHKKPKVIAFETDLQGSMAKPMASSSGAGGKQRTHHCSVCRAEFFSGPAFGGHMRKHRPAHLLENNLETKRKENKVLLFDLNLPALADDEPFIAQTPLVFTSRAATTALVDC